MNFILHLRIKFINMKPCKLLLASVLLLVGNMAMAQEKAIGGDKDAHGCLTAGGYTWSIVEKKCIRVFELPVKLNEVNPQGSSTSITGVAFSKDKKKAEIFTANESNSIILIKTGRVWKKGGYTLVKNGVNSYTLLKNKKVIFKS